MFRSQPVGSPVRCLVVLGFSVFVFVAPAGCGLEQGGLGAADPTVVQPDAGIRRPSYPPPPPAPVADPGPLNPPPAVPDAAPPPPPAIDGGAVAGPVDAAGSSQPSPPSPSPPPSPPSPPAAAPPPTPGDFCTGNQLLLCLPFDGNADDLGPARREMDVSGVTFEPGRRGQAALFGPGRQVEVRQGFPVPERIVSVELAVRPTSYPANGRRAGLVHSPDQYGVFLLGNQGDLECRTPNANAIARRAVPLGSSWTRVLCIFDEEDVEVYVNGRSEADGRSFQRLPVRGGGGIRIGITDLDGGPLTGSIDDLRIWRGRRNP